VPTWLEYQEHPWQTGEDHRTVHCTEKSIRQQKATFKHPDDSSAHDWYFFKCNTMNKIDNLTLGQIITDQTSDKTWSDFSSADWEFLLAQARSQGVAPLIYWKLSKSGNFSSIPEAVRNTLRTLYAATWMTNQRIFKELEILTQRFNEAGIPVVILKGACFALTIYPDIGLRPMGDLDLLVPGPKLAKAVGIARELGYVDAEQEATPGLNDLLSHHTCLQKLGSPACILEIHDSLVAEKAFVFAVSMDWFWEQTQALSSPSQKKYENLLMLTPTAQVLFAAAHAMLQHGGEDAPLRWFYDLDLLIRFYQEDIDWEMLLTQARYFEWGSALSAAFVQTIANFNTPVPDKVRANLAGLSDRHTKLVERLQTRPATHTLAEFQRLRSLAGCARFRLLMALIAPSPAYMRWRYKLKSSWALPAWYMARWAGIIKDAIRTLVSIYKANSSLFPKQAKRCAWQVFKIIPKV
jgi:hypothetical protein